MSVVVVPDKRLDTFYKHNPTFDILQASLTSQAELNGLNWLDVEQEPTLDVLKQYQRLLRLYPDPAVAQALLGSTSGDTSPAAPLHSAQAIAAIPRKQFVQKYSELVGSPTIAQQIHQNATKVTAQTQLLWANVQNLVASPHFRAMRVNNLAQDVYQFADLPGYQELFGSLDYCQCDECQSIFGPAAYFVDLLRIVDRYITTPNAQTIGDTSLDTRRPDLALIPLTCANTNDLLPFLDIVNTILETQAVYLNDKNFPPGASHEQISNAAYNFLATAIYPFSLPFHLPLEQIRSYLGHLKIDLATLYHTFNGAQAVVDQETLKLSPTEYTLITTANPDPTILASAYGISDPGKLLTQLGQETVFLQQTGLSRQNLSDLFTQNLSPQELQANLAHGFYINQALGQALYLPLAEDMISRLSSATLDSTLDRLLRFIRLARRLNWTFADLDWALHALGHSEIDAAALGDIATVKRLQTKVPVPLDVLCSFWFDIKTTGVGASGQSQALFDRIFNNPRMLGTQSPYHPQYANNPLYTDAPLTLPAANARIAASLGLSLADFTDLSAHFLKDGDLLTVHNLSILYRHTQLASLLKLPINQYFVLLKLANKQHPTFGVDDLFLLLETATWLNTSGFNVYELDYIVTATLSKYVATRYRDEDVQPFLQTLSASSANPQQDKLLQQLATFLGSTTDTVKALMEIIAPFLSLPLEPGITIQSYVEVFFLLPGKTTYTPGQLTFINLALSALSRALTLVDKMQLTSAEITGIGNTPSCYISNSIQQITLSDLQLLSTFKQLTTAFQDTQNLLVGYFAKLPPRSSAVASSPDAQAAALATITGWDGTQLNLMLASPFKGVSGLLTTVKGIARLKKAFDLNAALGADMAFQQKILPLAVTPPEMVLWPTYLDATNAIIGLVKAKYSDDAWTQISEKITGKLNEARRSALADYVMRQRNLKNLRALSEYLLVDVEMAGCAEISKIKQGILSLQMYLQRCRMNLESGVLTMQGIDEAWWEWMMSYRIWQANRKVFLYPENYLDPTLRKSQSDLFQELAAELLQSNITPDTVETAYQHYFDGLADLAKLRITESYRCSVKQPDGTDSVDTLFFFGRTATEPTTYYYRTCINPISTRPTWTPWSKMDVRIQSDYISPVFAFGKLFVFWVETQSQTMQTMQTSSTGSGVTTYKATIKYTFQTLSNQWVQPQTLEKDIVIGMNPENYQPTGVDLNIDDLVWKKIYALDVPAQIPATEKLLLLYGSMFFSPQTAPTQPKDPSIAFDKQVYAALLQSFNAAQGGLRGYSSVLPAATLNGNLLMESTSVILPFQPRHTTATLSQNRLWLSATTVGSLALFAGGSLGDNGPGSTTSNVVDIYDARTGKWSVDPYGLSQTRSSPAATTVGSLALFAGGQQGGEDLQPSSVVDIYDASATTLNKWTQETLPPSSDFPNGRTNMAATSVGSLALFAGGDDGLEGVTVSADLNIYDTQAKKWKTLTLSKARRDIAATTVGSLAIFVGGGDDSGAVNAVDIYDASTDQLHSLPSGILNAAIGSQAAVTVGSLALFAGGFTGSWGSGNLPEDATKIVNIYQAATQEWTTQPYLSVPRNWLAATSTGSQAFFAGGATGNTGAGGDESSNPPAPSSVCDVFDLFIQQWSTLQLSQARFGLAATSIGSLVLFAGGSPSMETGQATGTVDIFDTSNVIYNNYLSDVVNTDKDQQGEVSSLAQQLGLSQIKQNAAIFTVKNQPDWFTFDNGDEAFLAATEQSSSLISDSLELTDQANTLVVTYNGVPLSNPGQIVFTRLTTSVVEQLSQRAFVGGIDNLLTTASQGLPELDFARFHPWQGVRPPASQKLDFYGAYGTYFQEIFFHIPFLIANTLNTNQQFSDAQKWYQYIFNPTRPPHLAGYWPLNEGSGETLNDLAGNSNSSFFQASWQTASDFPGFAARSVLEVKHLGWVSFPPANLLLSSEMTVSFWSFGGNSSAERAAVFSRPSGDGSSSIIFHIIPPAPNGEVYFACGGSEASPDQITYHVDPKTYLYQGVWSHWAFTKNAVSGEMCIYLNGNLLYSEQNKTRLISTTSADDIAAIIVVAGKLAEVRMWRTALSADDIVYYMNEQPNDRFWRYLPFRGGTLETLQQILTDPQAIKAYDDDPFDPFAIAQVRFGTYQKAIVMKYIDNLLDWGDSLFTQDNWESITQATTLYLLAYDLLGPRPENLGSCPAPSPETFTDIKKQYGAGDIPQFLLELEQRVSIPAGISTVTSPPFNELNAYFGVSENDQFVAYWDRVEDRLYKIRHCQNIAGVVQQLALFEPPLNPMDLVRAVAAGNSPLGVASGLAADVPHYRFDALLERAKNITSTLIQLGESLLSALEKKDAEQLSLLKASQQVAILQLIKTTREKQISAAQAAVTSLNQSLVAATDRVTHYQGLLTSGLSANEQNSLQMMANALPLQEVATGLNAAATVLFLLPTIFGLADGGMDFGQSIATAASVSDGIAAVMNQQGSLAAAIAQYARRTEDWQLELQMAQDDVTLITRQIAAAQIAVDIATTELTSHQKSIGQANEIEDFLQRKFSSQDLYQWMVNRIADFYFQTFKLALDMALAVQKAYQFELNSDETYIGFNYWDNLKQGLLAGEGLLFGLNQLEKAYLANHSRSLEIEKTISLLQLDPLAFLKLKNTGKCQFQLSEQLFDSDFPGHYCRQIKTISLSIPAVVGPYQNINATLTQQSDKVLVQADATNGVNGVKYLLGVQGATQPDASILRSSWRRNQKIALSRGMNDSGMFELNFRDERYLPFEGTGAVSSWELSLPKATNRFDFSRLSDVIIHLSYTALDAGSGPFTNAVQNALNPSIGAYYINIKQTFPGAWHSLLSVQTDSTKQSLEFSLSSGIIPTHLTNVKLKKVSFKMDLSKNIDLSAAGSFLTLTVGNPLSKPKPVPIEFALDKNNSADVPIQDLSPEQFASTWMLSVKLTTAVGAILKDGFLDPALVRNMECILFYEGNIAWSE